VPDLRIADVFGIAFVSPHLQQLTFKLVDPNGSVVDLSKIQSTGTYPLNDDGTHAVPTLNLQLLKPIQGEYVLTVTSPLLLASPVPVQRHMLGVAIVYNDS
jgi:hypothetical protein